MRTRYLAIAMFLTTFRALGGDADVEPRQAAILGGIKLGATQATVRDLLGEPLRVVSTGDSLDPQFDYEGLTVWFWDGESVYQLQATGATICTASGVCPGMTITNAQAKLGPPIQQSSLREGRNEYHVAADLCWLEVLVTASVVQSLTIKCQP